MLKNISIIILICLMIIFAVISSVYFIAKNASAQYSEIGEYIHGFFIKGEDGDVFVIQPKGKNSEKFIQFIKKRNTQDYLSFGFPYASWSEKYFQKLEESLKENNIKFEILHTENQDVSKFIIVEPITDWQVAWKIVEIASSILEFDKDAKYEIYLN